jgi:hypothetical protein
MVWRARCEVAARVPSMKGKICECGVIAVQIVSIIVVLVSGGCLSCYNRNLELLNAVSGVVVLVNSLSRDVAGVAVHPEQTTLARRTVKTGTRSLQYDLVLVFAPRRQVSQVG